MATLPNVTRSYSWLRLLASIEGRVPTPPGKPWILLEVLEIKA